MPVTRAISRWLVPASISVIIVVCKYGFKTFNPAPLVRADKVNVPPALRRGCETRQLSRDYAPIRRGNLG